MKNPNRALQRALKTALAMALVTPLLASAESSIDTTSAYSASARLNFRVTIPGFLALRVGTGTIGSTIGTIDEVAFALTTAQAGTTGAYAATTNGTVTAELLGNVGTVGFAATGAALTDGANTIPLTAIAVTSGASTLAHPTFNAAAASLAPTAGRVNNRTGSWTFTYNHDAILYGAGNYTTQVTYTATAP